MAKVHIARVWCLEVYINISHKINLATFPFFNLKYLNYAPGSFLDRLLALFELWKSSLARYIGIRNKDGAEQERWNAHGCKNYTKYQCFFYG